MIDEIIKNLDTGLQITDPSMEYRDGHEVRNTNTKMASFLHHLKLKNPSLEVSVRGKLTAAVRKSVGKKLTPSDSASRLIFDQERIKTEGGIRKRVQE